MTAHDGDVKVSLSWSTGYTIPRPSCPTSNLFVHVHLNSPYIVESNTLSATWGEGYNVRITGSLQYKTGPSTTFQELKPSEYVIPDFYRGVPE